MSYSFTQELKRIFLFAIAGLVVGLLCQQVLLLLVITIVLYLAWHLSQLAKFDQWLNQKDQQNTPEASGIWGDIFHKVDRIHRLHAREKQRLHAVINRVESTTSALNDAVILLNERNIITWWNPAAERLLNFKKSDTGHFIGNFIRHPKFVNYIEGSDFDLPINLPAPQNIERNFQYQMTRFGADEGLLIVRDITHLNHLEQMRKDFVANVSHELRTPLTVLQGYLETLHESDQLNPKWNKAFEQMRQQTQRMNMLVNDLTELAKLETNRVEDQQNAIDLRSLLQRIISDATTISGDSQHQIELHIDQDWQLLGNERELHSAFSNILLNAVKYSPAKSRITVSVLQDHPKRLCVRIEDQGIGIESKHIHRLTERFYRVDASRSIATGGTGLGLAIVKHVLLRHNGQLIIESKLGVGSKFTCCFPEHQIINQVKALAQ